MHNNDETGQLQIFSDLQNPYPNLRSQDEINITWTIFVLSQLLAILAILDEKIATCCKLQQYSRVIHQEQFCMLHKMWPVIILSSITFWEHIPYNYSDFRITNFQIFIHIFNEDVCGLQKRKNCNLLRTYLTILLFIKIQIAPNASGLFMWTQPQPYATNTMNTLGECSYRDLKLILPLLSERRMQSSQIYRWTITCTSSARYLSKTFSIRW